jgi:hypothetical protein
MNLRNTQTFLWSLSLKMTWRLLTWNTKRHANLPYCRPHTITLIMSCHRSGNEEYYLRDMTPFSSVVSADFSEEYFTSVCSWALTWFARRPYRWMHCVLPERRWISIRLHDVTSENSALYAIGYRIQWLRLAPSKGPNCVGLFHFNLPPP